MSVRIESPPILAEPASRRTDDTRGPEGRQPGGVWARLAAVFVLLAVSGAARAWQGNRVERSLGESRVSPFPLAEIPMKLGSWEGRPTTLDPRIVRMSGSSDLIVRHYVDARTGTGVSVIVNFGQATDMLGHTPEICYPASGFEQVGLPSERTVVYDGGKPPVPFRSLVFSKGEGGPAETQEIYYSLRYNGRWTTESTSPKASRRIAGLCKIQVCRSVGPEERRDVDNPCEAFLARLLAEIEARIVATAPSPRS